ncbi:FecR domain-containing protein [Prosthecobacter sp.]|uniref:FecR domain-containing protein n=1 Tax=Prosthecobacter sp. TaxID=1965333 RepID=UPI003904C84B
MVPTDQMLLLSPKGTVKADTAAGKGSVINADLGEAKEHTGVVVAGGLSGAGTSPASSAIIVIPTAGVVKMDENTEVRLPAKPDPKLPPQKQSEAEGLGHNLELLKGRLFLNIDPEQVKQRGPATFRLKTPSALLAVKGTEFFSETTAQGDLVGVHEGAVIVYHPVTGTSVAIVAGQVVTISGMEISKPRALTVAEKKLDVNYAETRLKREPLKAEWKQPQHPYGKGTKSFSPGNKLGTEYQFALDMAAYNARPVSEVAPELELDVRRIKRKAVALEMVVRSWNLPGLTMGGTGLSLSLRSQDARQSRFGHFMPFKGTSNEALRTDEHREWTVVVPLDRMQAKKLPSPLALECGMVSSLRQYAIKPELQPIIEITGLTLITEDQ